MKIANNTPVTVTPANIPPNISFCPNTKPKKIGVNTANAPGKTILLIAAVVAISTHFA